MKWRNVNLIFRRDLRDQLRDRRTLFTVAIMPMVLYPLMGMAMLQVAQFMREYPTKVWIVGQENLPDNPALVAEGKINPVFGQSESQLIELLASNEGDQEFHAIIKQFREQSHMTRAPQLVDQLIQQEMQERGIDVTVFIPSPISIRATDDPEPGPETAAVIPQIYVFQNSAIDKSRIGSERINRVLANWTGAVIRETLTEHEVPLALVQGVRISNADVADKVKKQAAAWSKNPALYRNDLGTDGSVLSGD